MEIFSPLMVERKNASFPLGNKLFHHKLILILLAIMRLMKYYIEKEVITYNNCNKTKKQANLDFSYVFLMFFC